MLHTLFKNFKLYSLIIASGGVFLTGCELVPLKNDVAQRLAAPAWMVKRTIPAAPFELTAYERMHTRGASANIYIEGDGKAFLSKNTISRDPTPTNPVALHLAAYDKSENIAWLARPCQFTKMLSPDTKCNNAYWTNKRSAPEVIKAYHRALDNIANRYDITTFNLIGYSGGANIAAIIAAERNDVSSLRTVAGNLDHVVHSQHHNVSILDGSLNAVDYADKLRTVPQHHFIGGQDNIVPPAILHSYMEALGDTPCLKYSFIQTAEHEKGWVDSWPEFLDIPMSCSRTQDTKERLNPMYDNAPLSYHIFRETPEKP